eukprot:1153389-Pelagomonas_calceolata.AAC.1
MFVKVANLSSCRPSPSHAACALRQTSCATQWQGAHSVCLSNLQTSAAAAPPMLPVPYDKPSRATQQGADNAQTSKSRQYKQLWPLPSLAPCALRQTAAPSNGRVQIEGKKEPEQQHCKAFWRNRQGAKGPEQQHQGAGREAQPQRSGRGHKRSMIPVVLMPLGLVLACMTKGMKCTFKTLDGLATDNCKQVWIKRQTHLGPAASSASCSPHAPAPAPPAAPQTCIMYTKHGHHAPCSGSMQQHQLLLLQHEPAQPVRTIFRGIGVPKAPILRNSVLGPQANNRVLQGVCVAKPPQGDAGP